MEGEREIAAPGFADQYPELHHYTDLNGLRGIISTNTLWATHFSHLNDNTEVLLLREPMIDELVERVREALKTCHGNRHIRRTVSRSGYLR
jgi:hypothetical protein